MQVDKPLQDAACWKIRQRRHFGEVDLCKQGQRLAVGVARVFCVERQIGQPADFALAQGQIAAGLEDDFGSGFLGSEDGRLVGGEKGVVGYAHGFSFPVGNWVIIAAPNQYDTALPTLPENLRLPEKQGCRFRQPC